MVGSAICGPLFSRSASSWPPLLRTDKLKTLRSALQDNVITTVPSLQGLESLKSLSLSLNNIRQFSCRGLRALEELHIERSHLETITDVEDLWSIQVLNLAGNALTSFPFDVLNVLPNIDAVDLSSNSLSGSFPVLKGRYTVLNLQHNLLHGPGPFPCPASGCDWITPAGGMDPAPRLSYLDVSFNPIETFAGTILTHVTNTSGHSGEDRLFVLSLRSTSLRGATVLGSIAKSFQNLARLDLGDNPLLGGDLSGLTTAGNMLSLDISETNITAVGGVPPYLDARLDLMHRTQGNFSCFDIVSAVNGAMTFAYDDSCFGYQQCFCEAWLLCLVPIFPFAYSSCDCVCVGGWRAWQVRRDTSDIRRSAGNAAHQMMTIVPGEVNFPMPWRPMCTAVSVLRRTATMHLGLPTSRP